MSHDKPTEEIRELAALFSLGALTQHEADSFEAHIRKGCPVCEAEYRTFKHITAEIGLAVNEATAPDYIRELILARSERESPEETPAAGPEKEEAAADTGPKPAPRPILTQPPGKKRSIFPWILVVLFAVAAGIIFYLYHTEQLANSALKAEMDESGSKISDLETLLGNRKDLPEELEQIFSVVSKPETRILHMAGIAGNIASGAILWDVQQNKCLIFGYIPSAPEGKTYQLWFLTPSNEKIPSGLLKPDPAGRLFESFPIPEELSSLTMVITLEPEGGSKIPTLPYYAIGRQD